MRIFAIGDIHGEYFKLIKLLNTLETFHNLDLSKDKLVFLGDYIDRGLYSAQVLSELYNLQKKHKKNVVCLLGNHEQMLLDWKNGVDKWGLWMMNGGKETLASFDERSKTPYLFEDFCLVDVEVPKKYLKWLKKLPHIHREEGFVFSHAPLPREENRKSPRRAQGYFTKEECIWTAGPGKEQEYCRNMLYDNIVGVCGHVHALRGNKFEPRIYEHYIFTDAGCGCHPNAPLCAVEVISKQVIYSV